MDLLNNFMTTTGSRGGGITLENRHIEKAQMWVDQFEKLGVKTGVEKMLQAYFSELTTVGPCGAMGVVNKDTFNTDVLIPLLVTHTGLMLTMEQRGLLKMLGSLVSVAHKPTQLPIKSPKFLLKYKTFRQPIATQGQMSTKVPTAGAYFFTIEAHLEKRVVGFTLGELDFLFENNPFEIISVLAERMENLSTTWGVTTIYLHAAYAASQPSVSQMMLSHKIMHQPKDTYAKILQYCFMEHIICGALNRSPSNIKVMLANFGDFVQLTDNKEFVAMFPQGSSDGIMAYSSTEQTQSRKRTITYTTAGQSVENYCTFGHAQESTEVETLDVETMSLPNGCKAILLSIDGNGEDGCAAPMITDALKRVFFTIGGCPAAYTSRCQPSFFDCSGDICPKTVADTSPGTTYFMDFDRTVTCRLDLRQCHKVTSRSALFQSTASYNAWLKVFRKDLLGFVNERKTAKLLGVGTDEMLGSPLMMFETDPRHMWIVDAKNKAVPVKFTQQSAAGSGTGSVDYVYLMTRSVLGNASPCSRFENEVVGSIGGLAAMVRSFTTCTTDLVDRMCVELEMVDVAAVLAFRKLKPSQMTAADILDALKLVVAAKGVLSDPTCQVLFVVLFGLAVEDSDAVLAAYIAGNAVFLYKMVDMINCTIKETASIASTVYSSVFYNALLGAQQALILHAPAADFEIPIKYTDYLKFAYGFIMPALSKRVAVTIGVSHGPNILTRAISTDMGLGSIVNGVFVATSYQSSSMEFLVPYGSDVNTISIFRALFATRVNMLHRLFSGMPMVSMLALMHYWTAWNQATMENHMDKLYFSGLSYVAIRQMKFKGHTVAGVPVNGARFLVGNKYAGFPMATWQHTEYKQCMEMGIVPYDIASMGITAPCAFMSDIRGMGGSTDLGTFDDGMLILDSYNYYLPEGIKTHQSGLAMIPVQGRFSKLDIKADITGKFCQLPTAFFKASLMLEVHQEEHRGYSHDSTLGIFDAALSVDNFMDSLPKCIRGAVDDGFGPKDILSQVVTAKKSPASIFTRHFGGMFTDDYVIGEGSSQLLKTSTHASKLDCELMPRIVSVGGLNANAIFGAEASDPAFMAAFVKQFSIAKVANYRNF